MPGAWPPSKVRGYWGRGVASGAAAVVQAAEQYEYMEVAYTPRSCNKVRMH